MQRPYFLACLSPASRGVPGCDTNIVESRIALRHELRCVTNCVASQIALRHACVALPEDHELLKKYSVHVRDRRDKACLLVSRVDSFVSRPEPNSKRSFIITGG